MSDDPALIADWRDRWEASLVAMFRPESEASYFAGLYEEVARLRRNEGRFVGTSAVEAEAILDL